MLPPKKRQPGEYIRKLGEQRQQSAILRYALAGGVFVGTLFLVSIFSNSSVGIVLFLGGLTTSYYLYSNGQYLMKRAGDAQNGAKAETQVAALLLPLQRQGWQVEYNLRIRKWGDADVVLYSPKGNWFVIDVKSHSGTKVYESGRLRKCYGRNTYDFQEGDLISKVKGQASEVKSLKNARWVTGMLCFTRGDVDIPGNNAGGVYVVTANNLVNTLLQLDS
ncbi:nuclease-related domain-containing protein [Okeanomitos corallinicola TIOX110]|uniref:Nuclease-related domain-containing protein n=1 Tax=Okeanomitos corallinicola TIOX110 TaxID=3133117 RepID=A0ABZ2URD7_9CYAN